MSYPAFQPTRIDDERGLPISVIVGAALVVVGLGLIVFSVSTQGDSPLFVLGAVAVAGGALRMTTALARAARERRQYLATADDPRWHGGAKIVQLAGRTCVTCAKRIVVGTDGTSCRECHAPMHRDCALHHRAIAHAYDPMAS